MAERTVGTTEQGRTGIGAQMISDMAAQADIRPTEPPERMHAPGRWRRVLGGALMLVALVYALAALMMLAALASALLAGCGAFPQQGEEHNGRAWCCDDPYGADVLICGVRHQQEGCECRGLELGDLCLDPTVWKRGEPCTELELVCI